MKNACTITSSTHSCVRNSNNVSHTLFKKLLKKGVRDIVRISDARMSGTSYGACILHVAPESYVGGPLSLLETGDIIEINVDLRSINMLVDDKVLLKRKKKVISIPFKT